MMMPQQWEKSMKSTRNWVTGTFFFMYREREDETATELQLNII